MDVNTWFENGCNYQEGITVYASLKGHSPNLVRLFLRGQTLRNEEKLKYELGKHRQRPKRHSTADKEAKKKAPRGVSPAIKEAVINPPHLPANYFYRLNQLHPGLHQLAIKQRNDFQTAIAAKLRLNELHPEEEGEALKLCLQIEDLFDAIESAQKVLSHYVMHKVVLNLEPMSFSDLTPAQLLQRRNNKRAAIAKLKGRIAGYKKQLANEMPTAKKTKLKTQLEKIHRKLLQHEIELQQLNELIKIP
ncbi:hypothetical protein [Leptobacterium sp. I13]|uniref:hypothetical protein n=1 Tax=Leptobacterium meishanense TaxID=3128904 RepID=UPI0030EBCF94